jgi:hypothetical protein
VTVLKLIVVDYSCEACTPAAERQGWKELCECVLCERVGEGERGEAAHEEHRAKRD